MPRLNPNRATFWKRYQASDLRSALEACKDYAYEAHNLSVDRIAERMGCDKWALYKWIAEGRMPANMIRPYELACGIKLGTRYIAASADLITIDIPAGRSSTAEDMSAFQVSMLNVQAALLNFYKEKCTAGEALDAISCAMQDLAYHRVNVQKHAQPELEFVDERG